MQAGRSVGRQLGGGTRRGARSVAGLGGRALNPVAQGLIPEQGPAAVTEQAGGSSKVGPLVRCRPGCW